uniref:Rho-GAP domain-containing protein n=1 Tax=Anopheles dirus TaxID=7168 RepID=A0A182N261_9DIPT
MSLPGHTQRLLVLLFGTFRVIASNSERAETGMTSEALGVSVAPSFFQSCVSDGKTARMKDVLRFKGISRIWFGFRFLFLDCVDRPMYF